MSDKEEEKRGEVSPSKGLGFVPSEMSLAAPLSRFVISENWIPVSTEPEGNSSDVEIELNSCELSEMKIESPNKCKGGSSRALKTADTEESTSKLGRSKTSTTDHKPKMKMSTTTAQPKDDPKSSAGGQDDKAMSDCPVTTAEVRFEQIRLTLTNRMKHEQLQMMGFHCPIGECNAALTISKLLAHLLGSHADNEPIKVDEVSRVWLSLKPDDLRLAQNHCLGILLHQSDRQIVVNAELRQADWHLNNLMPILVMFSKSSWNELRQWRASPTDQWSVAGLYIVWLLCPHAQVPLVLTVSVCDDERVPLRRAVLTTCNTDEMLRGGDVFNRDLYFMRLTHVELKQLTENFKKPVRFEVQLGDRTKAYRAFATEAPTKTN